MILNADIAKIHLEDQLVDEMVNPSCKKPKKQ